MNDDPWNNLPDHDEKFIRLPETQRVNETPRYTTGEVIFGWVFVIAIIGGIIIGAVKLISLWLELPN